MPKVNPKILEWARETAGLSVEDAAKKLQIRKAGGVEPADRLRNLEAGKGDPTRPLLVRMAKQYRRPLVAFYLLDPPPQGSRGEDFRTLPEDHSARDEALLDALLRDVRARQGLVRAVLEEEDEAESLDFVGSMRQNNGVPAVVDAVRKFIGVDLETYRGQKGPREAFALLRDGAEQAGVYVLLIGNLGSHHSAIDLITFRGFAIADDIAPFIVINDQDSHAAWSFTLLHELAHISLGQTGISGSRAELEVEVFCNNVAAEFLIPAAELRKFPIDSNEDVVTLVGRVSGFARDRNVSSSMVAYGLFRQKRIDRQTWIALSESFRDRWIAERERRREEAREKSGGPDFYVVRGHRAGKALLHLMDRMISGGAITTSKAGKVLGVAPKQVQALLDAAGDSAPRRTA